MPNLYEALKAAGLLVYGSKIPLSLIHELIGIEPLEVGTRAQFDKIALAEVAATDDVRSKLLEMGMYFGKSKDGDGYYIPLPSENSKIIEKYFTEGRRKFNRARKLNRTTPTEHNAMPDQTEARIRAQLDGMRQPILTGKAKKAAKAKEHRELEAA